MVLFSRSPQGHGHRQQGWQSPHNTWMQIRMRTGQPARPSRQRGCKTWEGHAWVQVMGYQT